MKKSERLYLAMLAVADAEDIAAKDKLEVIETLMEEMNLAKYVEKREAEGWAVKE